MENKDNTEKTSLQGSKPETLTNNNTNNVVDTTTTTTTTTIAEEPTEIRSLTQTNTRTPFGELSQEDADLALARTLQEQERAYMMLRMNQDGIPYGSWDFFHDDDEEEDEDDHGDGTDGDDEEEEDNDEEEEDGDDESEYEEEDAFDVHAHAENGEDNPPDVEFDPAVYSSDEAFARALQEAEERDMAARLMALAGINDVELEDTDDHGSDSQDTWDEVDPDELSYEELLALGEVVGTESRGLSADKLASLPSVSYKSGSIQSGSSDTCVICRLEYEDGDTLTLLSCKHSYHPDCINNWLKINKVCPVCSAEVSTSGNS